MTTLGSQIARNTRPFLIGKSSDRRRPMGLSYLIDEEALRAIPKRQRLAVYSTSHWRWKPIDDANELFNSGNARASWASKDA